MNTIYINIIDSYWRMDEVTFFETGRKLRFYVAIEIDSDIQEFVDKLNRVIMEHKHDGLITEINSFGDTHYLDEILLLGEEEEEEEYSIDYILNFLNTFPSGKTKSSENAIVNYDKLIYSQYGDKEDVIKFLEDEGIEFKVISQTQRTYERGASDFWEGLLIAIVQSATWDSLKFLGGKLKHKFSNSHRVLEVANLDAKQLQKNLAELVAGNEQDLILISFTETATDEEKYNVEFRNQSEKFKVKANKSGEILEFKRSNLRTVTTAYNY